MSFSKIFAALDQSALSQTIFQQALDLAKSNNAKLMLFHALMSDTVPSPIPFTGDLGLSPQVINQAYQAQQVQLEHELHDVKLMLQHYSEICAEQSISTEIWCRVGDAASSICRIAHEWNADLIVMGRRGRRGITEVLLGSVSNYVLHHAHCAVLVMQSEEAGHASSKALQTSQPAV